MERNADQAQSTLGNLSPEDRSVLRQSIACVAEVMTKKVVTLRPEQPVSEAVSLFAERQFRHLLVVGADGRLAGVLSDRDVLRHCIRKPGISSPIAEVMTRNAVSVEPESAVSAAIRLMMEQRINCLPVVAKDGKVAGILTTTDLLRALYAIQYWLEKHAAALAV